MNKYNNSTIISLSVLELPSPHPQRKNVLLRLLSRIKYF